jgi:hypothetical protein
MGRFVFCIFILLFTISNHFCFYELAFKKKGVQGLRPETPRGFDRQYRIQPKFVRSSRIQQLTIFLKWVSFGAWVSAKKQNESKAGDYHSYFALSLFNWPIGKAKAHFFFLNMNIDSGGHRVQLRPSSALEKFGKTIIRIDGEGAVTYPGT